MKEQSAGIPVASFNNREMERLAESLMSESEKRSATLEKLIDASNVCTVLCAIADICEAKAQHISENWQDNVTAQAWHYAAKRVETLAVSKPISVLS